MEENKVRIGDYVIETDAYNWIVRKMATVKDEESKNYGKEYEAWVTYHATLHQVADKILDDINKKYWDNVGLILSSHELVLSKLDELIKLKKK